MRGTCRCAYECTTANKPPTATLTCSMGAWSPVLYKTRQQAITQSLEFVDHPERRKSKVKTSSLNVSLLLS